MIVETHSYLQQTTSLPSALNSHLQHDKSPGFGVTNLTPTAKYQKLFLD